MEYTGIHTYSTRCDGYGFMTVTLSVTDFSEEHSYKQVAEKWDSDSDSDQSDEEGFDLMI